MTTRSKATGLHCVAGLLLSSLIAMVLGGCSGGDDPLSGWDGVERDSAGITIVENFGTPLWGDEPLWTFHEVLRIGTADGDPDYQFGSITGLAILSDLRVVVADRLAHNVRFFSAEGVFEQAVGREGDGPGELGSGAIMLARMPGDTVLVMEGPSREVHVMAPDGTFIGDFSLAPQEGYRTTDFDISSSGRFVARWEPVLRPDVPTAEMPTVIIEYDTHGTVVDTVGVMPSIQTATREGGATLRYYYRGEVEFDLCAGGIWIAGSDDFRLGWYKASPRIPERVVTLQRERLALDGRDEAVMMAWYNALFQERQVPQGRATEIKSRVRFESSYPAFRRYVCGPASTLMVQQFHPLRDIEPTAENNPLRIGFNVARRPPPSDTWDVFDASGRYLGVVNPPWDQVWRGGFFVQAPDGGWYMYAVMQDELDLEYVVAWRVEGRMPAAD
jgi:hypothetical protein